VVLELRHLRYFVAVAEHLHFGRAAAALLTAQPSLSQQIQQLENDVGTPLFLRNNRRVELTDAGRTFLVDAQRILSDVDTSLRHVREVIDGTRGELRVAFIPGAIMTYLPAVFRAFRMRFPNVDVIPHALPFVQHASALHTGSVDVAWTGRTLDPALASQLVVDELTCAALPAWHRLAMRATIDVREFDADPLIVMSARVSPLLHHEIVALALARGYAPGRIHETDEEETVLGLVASGFGIALVPRSWSVMHIPKLVFCRIEPEHRLPQVLSWNKARSSPLVQSFVDVTLDVIADVGGPDAKRT
jgi:DNA-binding transcriptional LysR family regulator